jgi:hypothetical protein
MKKKSYANDDLSKIRPVNMVGKVLFEAMCQRSFASINAGVTVDNLQPGNLYSINAIYETPNSIWAKVRDGDWILAKQGKFTFLELEDLDGK